MESKKLRIAMYGKNKQDVEIAVTSISGYFSARENSVEILRFCDTDGLIDAFRNCNFSAVFLEMNNMSEVDTAWIIKKFAPKCPLVIMSDSGDYAMEGYRLGAFDYWLKPLDETKINQSLERIMINNLKIKGETKMEQIKALIEKAESDNELMAKLDELGNKDAGADEIINLAKEYGFTVTADDSEQLKNESIKAAETEEIKEEDLEAVAGGGGPTVNRYNPKTCVNLTRNKYDCKGFMGIAWCDHYRRTITKNKGGVIEGWHSCAMDAFGRYYGNLDGEPKKL